MKQKILDALHDLGDWVREVGDWIDDKRYWIAGALVVVLAVAALMAVPDAPTLEAYGVGPITIAEWTEVPGAIAYQVEAQGFDGRWQTLAMIWDGTRMSWPSPPGPMKYRVRAWTRDGPGRWSAPTQLIYFLPKPMIPDPDRRRQDA